MLIFWIIAGVAAFVLAAILVISYVCYRMAFYAPRNSTPVTDAIEFPEGDIYVPFHGVMEQWAREVRAMPFEAMQITSFDGLQLHGKYYEYAPDAPIELMFHGYRGNAERDLCGGVQRCFQLGHSALLVDQRCSGKSQGHVITFGILEHKDCLCWLDHMQKRFGPNARILLTGISMGAATVLMAAGKTLPDNVVGVLADCGYDAPKHIIQKVIRQIGLPEKLAYPFVKLGARLYGRFDLEAASPLEAMARCKVPVLFFHGETDDFVPCQMSKDNFAACQAKKHLVTIPGAGHGLCYPVDPETYLKEMRNFFSC